MPGRSKSKLQVPDGLEIVYVRNIGEAIRAALVE